MSSHARRRQPPLTIRSERARARLALLTADGRSQAAVIEEALDRMPLPGVLSREDALARLDALLARIADKPDRQQPVMEDDLYDEDGLPR